MLIKLITLMEARSTLVETLGRGMLDMLSMPRFIFLIVFIIKAFKRVVT